MEADTADAAALREAGVAQATSVALVYEDDESNIRAALTARRVNPRVRLVIRLYNRKLGRYLAELLDQAAVVAGGQAGESAITVLSDADTAAPALAATVVAGTSKVLQADGLLFRAIERTPLQRREATEPVLCTLALLSSTTEDPAGTEGTDASGPAGPGLLPAPMEIAQSAQRGAVVLEAVSHTAQSPAPGRLSTARLPLMELFSRRVRWSLAGFTAAVIAIAITSKITTGDPVAHSAYITLLDLFSINDPAVDDTVERQLLQLFTGLVGLLLLPVLVAAVLEASGSFRSASALRRPPRGTADHIVLLGLGKIGTRVLARLRELDIPVVCVEEDPEARGIPWPEACACRSYSATPPRTAFSKLPASTAPTPSSPSPAPTPPTSKPSSAPAPPTPTSAWHYACTTTNSPPPSTAPCAPPTPKR